MWPNFVNIRSAVLQLLQADKTDTSYQMVKTAVAPWSSQPRCIKEGHFIFVLQNIKNFALFFTKRENKYVPLSAKQAPIQILRDLTP
jgi:hypothetical protein